MKKVHDIDLNLLFTMFEWYEKKGFKIGCRVIQKKENFIAEFSRRMNEESYPICLVEESKLKKLKSWLKLVVKNYQLYRKMDKL